MIHFIPLPDIFVDYSWNVRSESSVRSNESDAVQDDQQIPQGEGLKGLKQTLALRGQDVPVVVRRVQHGTSLGGRRTACPFELVAGFRRFTAVSELPAVQGVPVGHIKAEVRELDDKEAVLLNARENTDRANLAPHDLARAVGRLVELGLTHDQIARELGITAYYVMMLGRVAKLPEQVLAHWRGEGSLPGVTGVPVKLTVSELCEIQKQGERESLLPYQVTERYVLALAAPRKPDRRGTGARDSERGTGVFIKRVHDAARLAGQLVRAGVLQEGSLDWTLVVGSGYEGFPIDIGPHSYDLREKYFEIARSAYYAAKEG